jgi:hypothetical protein
LLLAVKLGMADSESDCFIYIYDLQETEPQTFWTEPTLWPKWQPHHLRSFRIPAAADQPTTDLKDNKMIHRQSWTSWVSSVKMRPQLPHTTKVYKGHVWCSTIRLTLTGSKYAVYWMLQCFNAMPSHWTM